MTRKLRIRLTILALASATVCLVALGLAVIRGAAGKRCNRPDAEFVDAHFDAREIEHLSCDTVLPFRAAQIDAEGRRVFPHRDNAFWMWGPLRELGRMPGYLQLSQCYSLMHKIWLFAGIMSQSGGDTELWQTRIDGYRWREGEHDLRLYPGQAAWLLQEFLEADLPKIGPRSGPDDLLATFKAADEAVKQFRRQLLKDVSRAEQPRLSDLKNDYHKKVRFWQGEEKVPGRSPDQLVKSDAMDENRLNESLIRWQPIGRKLSELEAILGEPAYKVKSRSEVGEIWNYRIDKLFGGTSYEFYCKDGIILAAGVETLNHPMRRGDGR